MLKRTPIKQKEGICEMCFAKGNYHKTKLVRGLCQNHYKIVLNRESEERKIKRQQSAGNRLVNKDKFYTIVDDLSDLIKDADAVISRYVRLKDSFSGNVECYTCGTVINWKNAQNSHFISRSCMYLRWDLRNLRPACKKCNEGLHGNLVEYARKLNLENEGIVEILEEESRIIFTPSREYLRAIISEYTEKLDKLLKKNI